MYKILRRLILEQERINKRDALKTKLQDTFGFTPRIVKWITDLDEKRAVILARWILAKMDQRQEGSSKALKSTDPRARAQAVSVAEEAVEQVNVSARPLFDLLQQIGESGKPFDIRPYATVEDALTACMEEANSRNIEFNIDEDQTVVMKFPDGWYWLDLGKMFCSEEKEEMGHCATAAGDTLISLRDRLNKPHVTIDYSYDGIVFQIKGKGNKKPIPAYHPYIVEFLLHDDEEGEYAVQTMETQEMTYYGGSDFMLGDLKEDQFNRVIAEKPSLLNFQNLVSAIKSGKIDVLEMSKARPEMFNVTKNSAYYTQTLDEDHVIIMVKSKQIEDFLSDDDKKYAGFLNGDGYEIEHYGSSNDFDDIRRSLDANAKQAVLEFAASKGHQYSNYQDLLDDIELDELDDVRSTLDHVSSMASMTAEESAAYSAASKDILDAFESTLGPMEWVDDGLKFRIPLTTVVSIVSLLSDHGDVEDDLDLKTFDVCAVLEGLNETESGISNEIDIPGAMGRAYPTDEEISEAFVEALQSY